MDLQLQGKSVLITGASQGIGEGLALAFAQEGSHLRLVARSEPKLAAIAQRVRSEHGVSAEILPLDITAPAAVEKIMAFAGGCRRPDQQRREHSRGNLWEVDEPLWRAGWELKVFFDEVLTQVLELLQREKRVSYRALKRRFNLDDDYIEDLKV
jgi:NAD(P)-dependent dehydrogenase (short-subunit alcohol dehydrogenase family)